MPIKAMFRTAQRVGADGVELMLTPRLAAAGPARVTELERLAGVPIRSVHSIMRLGRTSPRREADDIVSSAVFASQLRQCQVLVVHTPRTSGLHTVDARLWLDALEHAGEILRDSPVALTVENSGRLRASDPTAFLDHPDRLRWFAEEWGVGITYDTAHAASRDWDVVASAVKLLPHLANVHLSDTGQHTYAFGMANAFLRDHRLPGRGTLPLEALIRLLASVRYDGLLTLELSPVALRVPWRRAAERHLREAILACRETVASGLPAAERSRQHHPRP